MSDATALNDLFEAEEAALVLSQQESAAKAATLSDIPDLEFSIKRYVLQALLEKAATVVPSKDTMMLLKNFEIRLSDKGLRVVATDLELAVVCITDLVQSGVQGTAVFPATKLLEIIRSAAEGDVHVSVHSGTAAVKVGRTSWALKLQPGDEYPELPDSHDVELFEVNRLKLVKGIQSVRYAAAKDSNRPSMMMIHIGDGKMTACDGVRFQQAVLGDDFPLNVQIPIGAVDDLLKLMKSTDLDTVKVGESDSHLVFQIGTDLFLANRMMADFPNMEELLLRPALENNQRLQVDHQELVSAIKRVRINADPESSAIGLELAPGTCRVISKDKYGNSAAEELTAGWDGPQRMLVVNHAFLEQLLAMYAQKSCSFFLGVDKKTRKCPILLRDEETGSLGTVQQMAAHWLGYEEK